MLQAGAVAVLGNNLQLTYFYQSSLLRDLMLPSAGSDRARKFRCEEDS